MGKLTPRPEAQRRAAVQKQRPRKGTIPSRYEAFMNGEITIEDLDEEEIMRGQLRGKDGTFRGRPPTFIPREFAQALAAAQKELIASEMAALVMPAMRTLVEVMDKPHPQPGDNAKVQAAKLVLERNLGKVPETLELKAEIKSWEQKFETRIKKVYHETPPVSGE